jgi:transcriptional regulator with XRE-family HTH domain
VGQKPKRPKKATAKTTTPVPAAPVGFPDHMRVAREALGLSHTQLATLAGFDKRSIGRYEQGLVEPSLQAAARLAVALGQSLDVMAGLAGPAADPELAALLARLQQLPPERQQLVKELIKALAG